jgi:hypothetical protein
MRTRFRKPLLYPLSYGGFVAQPCGSSRFVFSLTVPPVFLNSRAGPERSRFIQIG